MPRTLLQVLLQPRYKRIAGNEIDPSSDLHKEQSSQRKNIGDIVGNLALCVPDYAILRASTVLDIPYLPSR